MLMKGEEMSACTSFFKRLYQEGVAIMTNLEDDAERLVIAAASSEHPGKKVRL